MPSYGVKLSVIYGSLSDKMKNEQKILLWQFNCCTFVVLTSSVPEKFVVESIVGTISLFWMCFGLMSMTIKLRLSVRMYVKCFCYLLNFRLRKYFLFDFWIQWIDLETKPVQPWVLALHTFISTDSSFKLEIRVSVWNVVIVNHSVHP